MPDAEVSARDKFTMPQRSDFCACPISQYPRPSDHGPSRSWCLWKTNATFLAWIWYSALAFVPALASNQNMNSSSQCAYSVLDDLSRISPTLISFVVPNSKRRCLCLINQNSWKYRHDQTVCVWIYSPFLNTLTLCREFIMLISVVVSKVVSKRRCLMNQNSWNIVMLKQFGWFFHPRYIFHFWPLQGPKCLMSWREFILMISLECRNGVALSSKTFRNRPLLELCSKPLFTSHARWRR